MTEKELNDVTKFRQNAIWTQTLFQILVQGANYSGPSNPTNSELLYQLSSKVSGIVTKGVINPEGWNELKEFIAFVELVIKDNETRKLIEDAAKEGVTEDV